MSALLLAQIVGALIGICRPRERERSNGRNGHNGAPGQHWAVLIALTMPGDGALAFAFALPLGGQCRTDTLLESGSAARCRPNAAPNARAQRCLETDALRAIGTLLEMLFDLEHLVGRKLPVDERFEKGLPTPTRAHPVASLRLR
jgi:hypothetical protein